MPRTEDDTWDITESVGATALGVAAARAAETESERALIRDPFARVFLDAAGEGVWSMFSRPALAAQLADVDPDLPARMRAMVDFMASRTAFFDEFFLDAANAGVRQVVILATGLDSRAWRLPWPDGIVIYELDQPKVLEFKSTTLQQHGAHPTANQVNVPIDLRHDWPKALREAGFDPSAPTAWSAEGLLRFLSARAQDLLFDRIHVLSPAGSRVAVNAPSGDYLNPERLARERDQMQRLQSVAAKLLNTQAPDLSDLWYAEERTDIAGWLRDHGWQASVVAAADLMARYERSVPADIDGAMPPNVFISAQRS
jgi:methyltransferase (TIGR00027 family)